ncbi:MAG TPA: glutathione-disulfide reductase [Sphingomicrobium sp.]|nr:glutathione-disulfide reductase [Sphingomicrobium sp.]
MADFDLFVIGAGSGGVRAARVAAAHGAKVGIAEEHRVGGTCVIRGCVPKKLLVYGAHFAEDLDDAAMFGWDVPNKTFNWPVLRDNVLSEVDRLEQAYTSTLTNHEVEILRERAVLTGPNSVRLCSGREISAGRILIATGAHPQMPEIPGIQHAISSNETFHLDELPKRIVIAGGGYIANEFAGIFNEFGSQVTLVNRTDVLLRGYDQQIVDRLMQISLRKGIDYKFHATITAVEKLEDGRVRARMSGCDDIEADQVLFAIGRVPNTKGLGCDVAGVKLNDKGAVAVDADNRSSVDSIFAVGDVTDRVQLTPVAIREGQAFADTFFGNKPTRVDYSCIPSAVFSHPPLAGVGKTEGQARNSLGSVRTYTSDFRAMKNVLAGRDERSLYKLVVDEHTDQIVGVHMIGPDAPEILQAAAIAVKAKLKKADFDATIALHPTMAEELVLMR